MFRLTVVLLVILLLSPSGTSWANGVPSPNCRVVTVNGEAMKPIEGHAGYFMSRPACPVGTHTTGGGFRREFSNEEAVKDWRTEASFPFDTNGVLETWACWAKYVGVKRKAPKPPGELWCSAVCCPDN